VGCSPKKTRKAFLRDEEGRNRQKGEEHDMKRNTGGWNVWDACQSRGEKNPKRERGCCTQKRIFIPSPAAKEKGIPGQKTKEGG